MRISDWSSDVCSSDLFLAAEGDGKRHGRGHQTGILAAVKSAREISVAVGDKSDPFASLQAGIQEPPRQRHGLLAQIAIRQRFDKFALARIKVKTRLAAGGVVQRSEESRVGKEWVST